LTELRGEAARFFADFQKNFDAKPGFIKKRQCQAAIAIVKIDLSDVYRDYIACLNKQDWQKLEQFVHDDVWPKEVSCGRSASQAS
jgi:hypothetical protein